MATKKLSAAILALTAPEFGAEVEMPSISLDGTTVTATAAELNFVDGVTSNIQTQLAAKSATGHAHAGTDITSGTIDGDRLPAMSTTKKGAVPLSTTSTGSQVLADNGWKKINNLYTAFQTLTPVAGIVTWDMTAGYNALVVLNAACTLVITNIADGMSGCLKVVQDGTGNRTLDLPANSYLRGANELVLSTTANAKDMLTFSYDSTYGYWWSLGDNYQAV